MIDLSGLLEGPLGDLLVIFNPFIAVIEAIINLISALGAAFGGA